MKTTETTRWNLCCLRNGTEWVVASFASKEEAWSVRNGYAASGTHFYVRQA